MHPKVSVLLLRIRLAKYTPVTCNGLHTTVPRAALRGHEGAASKLNVRPWGCHVEWGARHAVGHAGGLSKGRPPCVYLCELSYRRL